MIMEWGQLDQLYLWQVHWKKKCGILKKKSNNNIVKWKYYLVSIFFFNRIILQSLKEINQPKLVG